MLLEGDWSHFAILNSNLTFIHFHALASTDEHISTAGDGVYAINRAHALPAPSSHSLPNDTAARTYISSLVASRRTWIPPPTFSREGMEYGVNLYEGKYKGWIWFPVELSVHYEPDYKADVFTTIRRDSGVRFVMRRAINGPITERVEPPDGITIHPLDDLEGTKETYNRDNRPYLTEYLYVHYKREKYMKWWSLPKDPLKQGDILYIYVLGGAQAWNESGEPWWTHWAENEIVPVWRILS